MVSDPSPERALDHPLARAALAEVIGLHVFFEAWLGGALANTPAAFSRLDHALAETFTLVTPEGERLARADVIDGLHAAHGARGVPFRIAIREPELLLLRPPLVVLGYVEEQTTGATLTRRRSTALFEHHPEGHAGPLWLALHETWVAPDP